jgi:ABC-type phosphate/phosphonate transport system ATPase subunit
MEKMKSKIERATIIVMKKKRKRMTRRKTRRTRRRIVMIVRYIELIVTFNYLEGQSRK